MSGSPLRPLPDPARDGYAVVARTARAFERTRVLSQAETFGVFDPRGDVTAEAGELGLYHEGTRFLSRLELRIEGRRPILLSSTVKESNELLAVDLTNPDLATRDGTEVPRGTLHLFRSRFLWREALHERMRVTNHGLEPLALELELLYDADFADVFEVRGTPRARRGQRLPPHFDAAEVELRYLGLDAAQRRTCLRFEPPPGELGDERAWFRLELAPQESWTLELRCACVIEERSIDGAPFARALDALTGWLDVLPPGETALRTDNEQLAQWIARSSSDLKMMTAETPGGLYPYAGIPWFNTIFGRDGIVTALELLWLDPRLARGVLATLAASQSRESQRARDAEPGKILHECRRGEMAALGEIPFGRYYGSVDATPLFVFLAGEYYRRTGDVAFIDDLWESIELALGWIDGPGDPDGDGFVEYARQNPEGLLQQGWKDSSDSVAHADGAIARGPIGLCEVQAYAYGARRAAAALAQALGRAERASELNARASEMRKRFDAAFWSDELGSYALALDGGKRPCLVRTSNAGQCLLTGIAYSARARRLATTLSDPRSFSGWGVRTLAAGERRYNPMSYHNGSVWPHDNALIARGLARYGLTAHVPPILRGLFEANTFLDLQRMPELFCGFKRRPGEGPTLYPAACAPQAWAAGTVFMLLEASLGLRIDAIRRRIVLTRPVLPETIDRLSVFRLGVGSASVDLVFERDEDRVNVRVPRRSGVVDIMIVK